ncbi:Fumarylacetoacetate hydrolase domain-containing-like protein [Cladobotryum mycophilum]|uniref:Fumarylacetoacetate hydrolase domain-containing-like protein n=1 Tax=Cladobotryum mycophilum TaxID=491253 RepID=A0ABR0SS24_9HYPO
MPVCTKATKMQPQNQDGRLIRFLSDDNCIYYGDAILPEGVVDISRSQQARVITGDVLGEHHVTDQVLDVRLLLPPLAPSQTGTVRCVGLNYASHAREADMSQPQYPLLFYKPRTALSGPVDVIKIPPMAQEGTGLDYECELVIVIGKKCKDVTEAEALDCILGYSVGNDVTHRDWQLKWGKANGPTERDPQNLKIWTKVNGELLQDATTAEMMFGVKKIVSLLSRGVTLMPGDVIFSGTPAGVGMCRNPQIWLEHGDVVEVGLEQVGTCTNKVQFITEDSRSCV